MAEFNNAVKEVNVESVKASQRTSKIIRYTITYLFLGIMAIIVIFPFYWMIISSFKTMDEYRANVPTLWPQNFVFEGLSDVRV